jgi:hypothetical protein
MSYLKIYYDKECTQLCSSYDLTPIIRFGTDEIRNIDYWKLNSNEIVTENELISYGEYILKIVENYKKVEPEFKLEVFMLSYKPENFNSIIYISLMYNKDYNSLYNFVSNYNKILCNQFLVEEYIPFKSYLMNIEMNLYQHLNNPSYCYTNTNTNIDIDNKNGVRNYVSEQLLIDIKSFGYFNLKYGDSGYTGRWEKERRGEKQEEKRAEN